ncbi:hypothetical protein Sjap_014599 [Stephania japonica]|uniref:Uncharacterized protein n=1 Tax=Stephania japonica TaxID=461633 RepID=A0AAP0IJG5_9MAGN
MQYDVDVPTFIKRTMSTENNSNNQFPDLVKQRETRGYALGFAGALYAGYDSSDRARAKRGKGPYLGNHVDLGVVIRVTIVQVAIILTTVKIFHAIEDSPYPRGFGGYRDEYENSFPGGLTRLALTCRRLARGPRRFRPDEAQLVVARALAASLFDLWDGQRVKCMLRVAPYDSGKRLADSSHHRLDEGIEEKDAKVGRFQVTSLLQLSAILHSGEANCEFNFERIAGMAKKLLKKPSLHFIVLPRKKRLLLQNLSKMGEEVDWNLHTRSRMFDKEAGEYDTLMCNLEEVHVT